MGARITSEVIELRHEFTQDEKNKMASELAAAYNTQQKINEEKKSSAAQYKERETSLDLIIGSISRNYQNGFETRNVKCRLVWDEPNVGEVSYYDPEGKLVKTRAMNDSERQMDLGLEPPKDEAEEQRSIERSHQNIKNFIPGSKTKKDAADGDPEGQCKNCELWFPASVLKTTDVDFHDLCPGCWDQCVEEPKRQAAEPAQEAPPTQADGTEPPEGEAPPADPEAGPELNF